MFFFLALYRFPSGGTRRAARDKYTPASYMNMTGRNRAMQQNKLYK